MTWRTSPSENWVAIPNGTSVDTKDETYTGIKKDDANRVTPPPLIVTTFVQPRNANNDVSDIITRKKVKI